MKLRISVRGESYEVDVEVLDPGEAFLGSSALPDVRTLRPAAPAPEPVVPARAAAQPAAPVARGGGNELLSPVAGTIVEVCCAVGDEVKAGQTLLVIEAMKMNTDIKASAAAKIASISAKSGVAVREGEPLITFA